MKIEPSIQEEQLSTTGNVTGTNGPSAANGSLGPMSKYVIDTEKADLLQGSLWTSVTSKLASKTGSVNTPDGEFFIVVINIFLHFVSF